jgi:colicin import membrane protein
LFRGLLTSFVGHALLLGWALLSIPRAPLDLPETVTIEATLVTPSELTRLKQGNPDSKEMEAKAKDEPKPEISKKEAEKPKPVTEPPPPPPPEPEKTETAKPKEDPIAEKLAAAPPPPVEPPPEPGPSLAEKKKLEEKLEQERIAEEKKKAQEKKKAEAKKKAEEKKKAEAKKRAEEKKKAEEAKKKKEFDPDRIAALIDKSPDKRGAPRAAQEPTKPTEYTGPAAGERQGNDTVLTAREADMLKAQLSGQLRRCWNLPGGGGGIETIVVTLKWHLKPDGSLDGVPEVVQPQSGPVFQIAAEAAVRAVTRCAPFDLPPDKYGVWKTVTWNFDPREMM